MGKKGTKHKTIYSIKILSKKEYKDRDLDVIESKIKKTIDNFIENDLIEIESHFMTNWKQQSDLQIDTTPTENYVENNILTLIKEILHDKKEIISKEDLIRKAGITYGHNKDTIEYAIENLIKNSKLIKEKENNLKFVDE